MTEKVEKYDLRSRAGNGAVATGSYTQLVGANPRRRWFAVAVPITEADPMLLVLPSEAGAPAGSEYGQIYVAPGASVVLSMSGDMPWQGVILATGYLAASYCFWTETEDRVD